MKIPLIRIRPWKNRMRIRSNDFFNAIVEDRAVGSDYDPPDPDPTMEKTDPDPTVEKTDADPT